MDSKTAQEGTHYVTIHQQYFIYEYPTVHSILYRQYCRV